jgi:hypothetical protein
VDINGNVLTRHFGTPLDRKLLLAPAIRNVDWRDGVAKKDQTKEGERAGERQPEPCPEEGR